MPAPPNLDVVKLIIIDGPDDVHIRYAPCPDPANFNIAASEPAEEFGMTEEWDRNLANYQLLKFKKDGRLHEHALLEPLAVLDLRNIGRVLILVSVIGVEQNRDIVHFAEYVREAQASVAQEAALFQVASTPVASTSRNGAAVIEISSSPEPDIYEDPSSEIEFVSEASEVILSFKSPVSHASPCSIPFLQLSDTSDSSPTMSCPHLEKRAMYFELCTSSFPLGTKDDDFRSLPEATTLAAPMPHIARCSPSTSSLTGAPAVAARALPHFSFPVHNFSFSIIATCIHTTMAMPRRLRATVLEEWAVLPATHSCYTHHTHTGISPEQDRPVGPLLPEVERVVAERRAEVARRQTTWAEKGASGYAPIARTMQRQYQAVCPSVGYAKCNARRTCLWACANVRLPTVWVHVCSAVYPDNSQSVPGCAGEGCKGGGCRCRGGEEADRGNNVGAAGQVRQDGDDGPDKVSAQTALVACGIGARNERCRLWTSMPRPLCQSGTIVLTHINSTRAAASVPPTMTTHRPVFKSPLDRRNHRLRGSTEAEFNQGAITTVWNRLNASERSDLLSIAALPYTNKPLPVNSRPPRIPPAPAPAGPSRQRQHSPPAAGSSQQRLPSALPPDDSEGCREVTVRFYYQDNCFKDMQLEAPTSLRLLLMKSINLRHLRQIGVNTKTKVEHYVGSQKKWKPQRWATQIHVSDGEVVLLRKQGVAVPKNATRFLNN
uniref:Uncharacterized protein n=1 Tax=Mycena chlorophos TaxID=658473 RepID=A0ABQ0L2X8_MYCCL|nr:predicted protein [Mycena chlorophos]